MPHEGPICKNVNAAADTKVEEADSGMSIESKIQSISLRKDSRGDFQALIFKNAVEVKHRSISKNRLHFLQT